MLNSAGHIYIVGVRSCAPLAEFLGFYLRMINDNVRMVTTNSASEMFEQMLPINEKDVVVGISFPRYSMRTLKCMEYANNKSAEVIAITDSRNSPMSLYSSCNLLARSDMTSIVDSLVAPMSVINALIVALCMKNKERVVQKLEELNRVWSDYQVYNNDEINQLEENLKTINNKTLKRSYGNPPTYVANGNTMDFAELNRLERAILDLYDRLTNESEGRRMFTWNFGMRGGDL